MRWHRFESTAIAAAGYSAGESQLEVVFTSGERYRYFLVPAEVFDEFVVAESAGAFFQARIRGRYPFRHVQRTR